VTAPSLPAPNLSPARTWLTTYLVAAVVFAVLDLEWLGLVAQRLYGFVTYSTWDLTSMAVFPDFPLTMVLVDLAWGVTACVVVTAITTRLLRSLLSTPSMPPMPPTHSTKAR